jgi:DNA-directed RNA polymerase specialized sigma24 family protein
MLSSEVLLDDWTPITELCGVAIAKLGASISPDEISSDVAVVLVERGCLAPGAEIKEAFVIEIARRCALAALRKRKKAPLPLVDDVAGLVADEAVSDDRDDADKLFKQLLNSRPRKCEVEQTARELMLDAIRRVFREKSARDQAIIVRRLAEEQSIADIAAVLNATDNTVSQVVTRFKKDVWLEYARLSESS